MCANLGSISAGIGSLGLILSDYDVFMWHLSLVFFVFHVRLTVFSVHRYIDEPKLAIISFVSMSVIHKSLEINNTSFIQAQETLTAASASCFFLAILEAELSRCFSKSLLSKERKWKK